MSKRELGQLNASEVEGPRTKRRRETAGASSDVDVHSDPVVPGKEEGVAKEEGVKELGLKLWQTVKDAVNKEGRLLSVDFLRRPSKRQYPDYYRLIQHPIALDDIKKQLENGSYATFEAVKQDFELCFNNAKQYNMKESDIWKDAKELLKLVNKTYSKMVPADVAGENAEGDEKKGKSKVPSLTRLVKSRLQKLVDKTDDSGRVLSVEFMDLPSKKEWPIYYKEIKRPQCLENIFKRIKRKEYHTAGEFATDVELVFANAMSFNQEHTGIWEDARTLRDYFRVLMSDLPPPYALPEYAKPSNTKIKLRMPQPSQPSGPSNPPTQTSTSSLVVRVPAASQVKASPAPTPIPANLPSPKAATATPPPAPPMTLPSTQSIQVHTGSTQPVSYINPTFSHYPNASYIPPVAPSPIPPTASTSTSNVPAHPVVQAHSTSHSPAPPPHSTHQLKSINMRIEPRGRFVNLDYRDGVKCWAVRLVPGEKEVHVDQVSFLSDEEEESSDEEDDEAELEGKHEEEEEESMEVDLPAKNGRKKGKGKGRGRPRKVTRAVAAKAKDVTVKKRKQKVGLIQVKLNGAIIKGREDEGGKWTINPLVGSNVLEIGETGGLVWKVYIQRMSDA